MSCNHRCPGVIFNRNYLSMQKLRLVLLFIFSGFSFASRSQFIVTGSVLDSSSREPLTLASVFCQNTTSGTYTNKQGEFSISLKSGGYDLIISYTGYQTQTIRVSENLPAGQAGNKLEVLLVKEDKSMSEVIIKSSNEVANGWDKYGDFFVKNFIGATPNAAQTVILNPEVLKFYYYKRSNKLKVLTTDAVQIANKALGYNLRYQLDSFIYYYNTDINSYRGYCFYSEMEGSDSLKKVWAIARSKTYYGSRLHFMRSYYDSTLLEDSWIVDLLDEKNDMKFNKVANPYDTLYYGSLDSTQEIEIWFPRKISVTYTKVKPEAEYLKKSGLPKNLGYQISYIDLKDAIAIKENGYYYNQRDWVNQGYWSWKNLADQLPYDYNPPD